MLNASFDLFFCLIIIIKSKEKNDVLNTFFGSKSKEKNGVSNAYFGLESKRKSTKYTGKKYVQKK